MGQRFALALKGAFPAFAPKSGAPGWLWFLEGAGLLSSLGLPGSVELGTLHHQKHAG
jgi:hypothetical protein